MWNVKEKTQNIVLKGYDKRPLRFTEKHYADRLAHELNEQKENSCLYFYVVEENYESR